MDGKWKRRIIGMTVARVLLIFFSVIGDFHYGYTEPAHPADNEVAAIQEEITFLREEAVLLKKHELQVETGMLYSTDTKILLLDDPTGKPFLTELVDSSINVPVTVRYGLASGLQGFINVPFTRREIQLRTNLNSATMIGSGVGDIQAGLRYQIYQEQGIIPDLVFGFSGKARNGSDPYSTSPDSPPLGTGHYSFTSDIVAIRAIDPVVFFMKGGYEYTVKRTVKDNKLDPGNSFLYNVGIGYALNDQVTINTQLDGAIVGRNKVNGKEEGFVLNLVNLQMGASILASKNIFLSPTINIGLTNETPDLGIGLSVTYQSKI